MIISITTFKHVKTIFGIVKNVSLFYAKDATQNAPMSILLNGVDPRKQIQSQSLTPLTFETSVFKQDIGYGELRSWVIFIIHNGR
jgi:hypothetical protein